MALLFIILTALYYLLTMRVSSHTDVYNDKVEEFYVIIYSRA